MEIFFFLSAFFSEVVGTTADFGSSTIFLPLALLFLDFRNALTLVAFLHIFGNLGRVGFFRKGLNKDIIVRFGIPSVIFTLIGALLVKYISQDLLKGILGLFLIFYSLLNLAKEGISFPATNFNTIVGGGLSGFLAGLIGTGGALRAAFLTSFGLPKEKYIATAASIALVVDATRIPVYLNQGFLGRGFYWYIPVLFLIALFGSFVGRQIVEKIPQKIFKKIVLVAILLVGVKLLRDSLLTY